MAAAGSSPSFAAAASATPAMTLDRYQQQQRRSRSRWPVTGGGGGVHRPMLLGLEMSITTASALADTLASTSAAIPGARVLNVALMESILQMATRLSALKSHLTR